MGEIVRSNVCTCITHLVLIYLMILFCAKNHNLFGYCQIYLVTFSMIPLHTNFSIIADKDLRNYPGGISAIRRCCHRLLHQYTNSQMKQILFSNNDLNNTYSDADISSMKRLLELFHNAFRRFPQIHRQWYLQKPLTSALERDTDYSVNTQWSFKLLCM